MSQCARVALWVPTADPAAINNAILVSQMPDAQDVIKTRFAAAGGGGSGGGIDEAPLDGQQYARKDAAWVVVATAGIPPTLDGGTF